MPPEPGRAAPRMVSQVSRADVPAGYWLHADHFPFAVTPLSADFNFGKHMPDGFAAAGQAFTLGGSPPDFLVVDGFVYGDVKLPPPPSPERIARFEELAREDWPRQRLRAWQEEMAPAIRAEIRRLRGLELAALDDAGLLEYIRTASDRVSEWYGIHFTNSQMGTQLLARARFFCRDHFDLDDNDFLALLTGASAATSDGVRLLDQLAADALARPDVLAALDAPDPWAAPALRELLAPYLAAHGHTALDQADYAVPTLEEQPERVVRLFREALERQRGGAASVVQQQTQAREQRVNALRGQLTDAALRAQFDALLTQAQEAYGVRDTDISIVFQGMGLLRYGLKEAGRRLAQQGVIADAGHVWFLRRDELEAALAGDAATGWRDRAAARLAQHEQRKGVHPPSRFGTPPEGAPVRPTGLAPEAQQALEAQAWSESVNRRQRGAGGDTPNEIKGRGASKGTYTGPARVVLQEADFDKVQPGDVLVSKFTMPSWNVLLGKVKAIVTDEGGIISHAAIVAREFGIPAVVGTRLSTTALQDGQTVTVDGATGVVKY